MKVLYIVNALIKLKNTNWKRSFQKDLYAIIYENNFQRSIIFLSTQNHLISFKLIIVILKRKKRDKSTPEI